MFKEKGRNILQFALNVMIPVDVTLDSRIEYPYS